MLNSKNTLQGNSTWSCSELQVHIKAASEAFRRRLAVRLDQIRRMVVVVDAPASPRAVAEPACAASELERS